MIPATNDGFPVAVVVVNLLGSFLLGLFLARREGTIGGPTSLQFWAIGVLGSFTTFSAFSMDLVELVAAGRVFASLWYVSLSLLGGLALARFGRRIGAVVR
jgi:fluoride exporter